MSGRGARWVSLRTRGTGRWSNVHAAILTGAGITVLGGMIVGVIVRQDRLLEERRSTWPFSVPWDPAWPSLPDVSTVGALSIELAQTVYALVATNEDTLQYIPCYCGCRSQGHGSVHHCHVKRRTADGRIVEWNDHGRICPLGADIAGDAVLWRQRGTTLAQVRADIEEEYSSRGPATPTPPVPIH